MPPSGCSLKLCIGDNPPNNPGSLCEQAANNVNNLGLITKAVCHSQSSTRRGSAEIAARTLSVMWLLNFFTDLNTELI